jgi:hypothetical protein
LQFPDRTSYEGINIDELPQADLISTFVTLAVNEENLYKKLRLTNIVLCSMNQSIITETNATKYHKNLRELLKSSDFLRKLKLNATIKENPASAIEYLGKDYIGGDENYVFDEDFEDFLTTLKMETEEVLGRIVKELSKPVDAIDFGGAEIEQ